MWEKYYLLDLSVLMNGGGEPPKTDAMKKEMEALLDRERLLKYRQKKNEKGAMQSLGAGLLLQLAVQEYAELRRCDKRTDPGGRIMLENRMDPGERSAREERVSQKKCAMREDRMDSGERSVREKRNSQDECAIREDRTSQDECTLQEEGFLRGTDPLQQYTPQIIIDCLQGKQPMEPAYRYGTQGKPYFQDLPLCFSLSHSGEAVFLAVSEREIGADIQHVTGADWKTLAERFYGRTDLDRMGICENNDIMGEVAEKPGSATIHGTDSSFGDAEKRELFYQLWTRKEAYGKLTGEGVSKYLDREVPSEEQGISWDCRKTTIGGKDYFLSVCRKT